MELQKTLKDIADMVQGELLSAAKWGAIPIKGVGSLSHATEGEITFLSDKKYLSGLKQSKASAVFVSESINVDTPQIIVSNPKMAVAKLLAFFTTFPNLPSGVHPQSVQESKVELGKEVTIGPFSYIGAGAKIGNRSIIYPGVFIGAGATVGDDCVLFPNVTLYPGTILGDRVLVHAGSVLGADGFGYVFDGKQHQKVPQVGNLVVEDDVEVGANSAIDRAAIDTTRIGRGTKIDNLVQVGHNCDLGPANILCGQVGLAGGVKTGTGVVFGGQVGVADQSVIPDRVKFAGQSGVSSSLTLLETKKTYMGSPVIESKQYFRLFATLLSLPDLYKRLKLLEKKVTQLLDKEL